MTGHHTEVVSKGLRIGMALFITSEVLFFFAFFWAYFWGALHHPVDVAGLQLAARRAPIRSTTWDIPFLNTMILLLSGCTVTWAHHRVREGDNATATKALALTVTLGDHLHRPPGLRVRAHHPLERRLHDQRAGSSARPSTWRPASTAFT